MDKLPVQTVLAWALRIESSGEAFYREAATKAQDRDVKLLFEDLAHQEQRHRRTFERMLERVPVAEESVSAEAAQEYESYLRTALSQTLFAGPESGLALARQAADEAAALRAAIAFEKDTLLFYYDLHDLVPEAHRSALTAIVQEESSHVRQLAKVLYNGPWVS